MGKLVFSDTGLDAVWLGDILASIKYTDIRTIETTNSIIFHWYKIAYGNKDEALYIQPSSNKRFSKMITDRDISIAVVKRLL